MAAITLTNLSKSFGPVEVLKNINLTIADQEFCVLVGPSGYGKSTLLRLIAGLEEVKDGTIEIGGDVVNDLRPRDRNLAMVFQSYALYPHKTVRENLSFSLKIHRYRRDRIDRAVMSKLAPEMQKIVRGGDIPDALAATDKSIQRLLSR